jgi:hypothetical protein
MNSERRLLLREIVAQIEQAQEKLRKIWVEEEESYETRITASKETARGTISREAIEGFEGALDSIEEGCEILRGIVAQE